MYGLGLPPMGVHALRPRASVANVNKKQHRRKDDESGSSTNQSLHEQPRAAHKQQLPMKPARSGADSERRHSLQVNWTLEDVARLAKQVYDGTIADVHLSLFGYWIRESDEHYNIVKQHIRELSLDQGYNLARIENVHLRKLLEDVHQIRPKEPVHAAAVKFQTLGTAPRCAPAIMNRSTSSPVTAKTESLPPSFRAERERAMREAVRSSSLNSVSSSTRDYPPDTPDRPAPLSLRSCGSKRSNATSPTTGLSRSISSPGRTSIALPMPRTSVLFKDTASHPLLNSSSRACIRTGSEAGIDDVFGLMSQGALRQRDSSNDIDSKVEENDCTRSRTYTSEELYSQYTPGPYKLDPHETSSYASHEANESRSMNGSDATSVSLIGEQAHILRGETFDAISVYSRSDDDISILETASTVSHANSQTRYSYTIPASPSRLNQAEPAPTLSASASAVQVQHKNDESSPLANPKKFHRPLPLRSSQSEAHLYSASCTEGTPNQDRAKSAHKKTMRCNRATPLTIEPAPFAQAIPLPPRSSTITAQSRRLPLRPTYKATSGGHSQRHHGVLSIHVEDTGGTEACNNLTGSRTTSSASNSSMASTLAAFPIPPMENPVGELPMIISCATARSALASTSVAEAYRAITKAHIAEVLQRTRQHGAELPVLEWDDIPTFERTWREVNEQLLVSIYGRRDVMLTSEDVEYVDCISRELRGGTYSSDWMRDLFQPGL